MATADAATQTSIAVAQSDPNAVTGLGRLPVIKQLGVMIGLAASIALGMYLFEYVQKASYEPLYSGLSGKGAQEVIDSLKASGIKYEINEGDGTVMVPGSDVHRAKISLAADGLPRGDSAGFEVLEQEQSFGTSQFIERARYQRALEIELARTIATLNPVKNARVHLAVPKQSVFVRHRKRPSASVTVDLFAGRSLDDGQIAAITHMVASSVPGLESAEVSVVDSRGNMLNQPGDDQKTLVSNTQYKYTRKLEADYQQRILSILEPFVGKQSLQAEVTAEIDFTHVEQTREAYNPDLPALRSEQTSEQSGSSATLAGVPGALSNQPPGAGNAPEVAGGGSSGKNRNSASRKNVTRNYELDKTVSHTVMPTPKIKRLTVAVVVDDSKQVDKDGNVNRTPRTPEEIERIRSLVKEVVAFDVLRGDRVSVINSAFIDPEAPEPLPELSLMEQPWIWDVARQTLGVLMILLLIFLVLRPAMKRLTNNEAMLQNAIRQAKQTALENNPEAAPAAGAGGQAQLGAPAGGMGGLNAEAPIDIPGNTAQEQRLNTVKAVVNDDPRRSAQVVRNWMNEDE